MLEAGNDMSEGLEKDAGSISRNERRHSQSMENEPGKTETRGSYEPN